VEHTSDNEAVFAS